MLSYIIAAISIFLFITGCIHAFRHGSPGYGGCPDEWDSKFHETLNAFLAISSIVGIVISIIVKLF